MAFLRRRFEILGDKQEDKEKCKKIVRVMPRDLIWIIIILLITIIELCALLIVDCANAANILSVVSTGISIVLSVVAIIYTFIAGAESSNLNVETRTQIMQLETQIKLLNDGIKRKKELQEEITKYTSEVKPLVEEMAQSNNGTIKIDSSTRARALRLKEIIEQDIVNDE